MEKLNVDKCIPYEIYDCNRADTTLIFHFLLIQSP